MHVVADENERAFVLTERADEGVDRADIEMGRRLVHEEEVGRIKEQLDQGETRFFTAAEHADRLENVVAAKEKRAEHGPRSLFRDRLGNIEHALEDGVPDVEHLNPMLREITDPDVVPRDAFALLHRQHSGEQLEQGRFPGAVGSDEDGPLSALGFEIQLPVDDQLAVGVPHVLEGDGAQTAPRRLREMELDRLRLRGRARRFSPSDRSASACSGPAMPCSPSPGSDRRNAGVIRFPFAGFCRRRAAALRAPLFVRRSCPSCRDNGSIWRARSRRCCRRARSEIRDRARS